MNPCESCHAGCCRSFAVPVTGADILRIERGLGLSFWDFVCRWADPKGIIARNHAPHFRFSDEPQTPFVICLTHEESRFFKGSARCKFLVENQPDEKHPLGTAHCGIYHLRPGACRAFPTRLNNTGELAIIYDVPERGRDNSDPLYELCPRQWEPADLDPVGGVQDLVVARYEMDFFRQIAQVWNRVPRSWNVFPDFLHLVYERRVVRESDVAEEPPATIPLPVDRTRKAA